jgi:hypothetical protein
MRGRFYPVLGQLGSGVKKSALQLRKGGGIIRESTVDQGSLMSPPPRSSSAPKLASVLNPILLAFLCSASSAVAQKPEMNQAAPKVLEETFAFPAPLQWKVGDIELSVIGLAWGPADSQEMIAKGREVQAREQPQFFPDRPYALALRFRAKRAEPSPDMATSSGLQRIKNVEGEREYPWALTPSGFVQFVNGMPGIWDVHFRGSDTAEYWDFFPVSPDRKKFLFQVNPPATDPALSFRVVANNGKLSVSNVTPAKPEQFTREFIGTIGADSKLRMQLTANGSELSGTERYARVGKTLWVRGALDSLGNFKLTEYYPENQPTGIFDGKFARGYLEMTGYFAKPGGSRLLPFDLRETSTIDNPNQVGGARGPAPCPTVETPTGWKVYVNQKYGFCLSYPATYERVAEPWLEKYTNSGESSKVVRQEAEEGRVATFQHRQKPDLSIGILIGTEPFDLQSFVKQAPTGEEGPPEARDIRGRTFYYYGPGGGGVCYGDQFFYNLRGKPLFIYFDGCVDDKTPPPETKKIEEVMLATFGTF